MNFTSRVRTFMEHNRYLRKFVSQIKRSKVVQVLHRIDIAKNRKSKIEEMVRFKKYYEKYNARFKEVYRLLEDEESRNVFKAVIEFRKTLNYNVIKQYVLYPQYFVKEIFESYNDEIFVDGGAYNGDTILSLLENGGHINKAYAWEPDEQNAKAMLEELGNKTEIIWIPCAMYKEHTTLRFTNSGSGGSALSDEGDMTVNADCIDNLCPDATFIKMDIEGAEIEALYGSKETIIRNKPKLAICIYHKPEHLFQIPLLIHEWVPEYKLYIRHHSDYAAETVLYAKI